MAEDENKIVVVGGYQPPWNNLLKQGDITSVRQHLIDAHNLLPDEVAKLRDYECWERHDREHEKALGGTLIRG